MVKKGRGFTLVELLAVIVILAIILVIAVPSIMSTITESKKGSLASSAKLIASSVESAMISNQALGISREITCADVSNYNREDYECSIKVLGNKPYVSLIGKGKFEGMSSCYGTKENASVIEANTCPPLAVEKITTLANNASNTEGLEKTNDGNIRYTGGHTAVKNYVKFNNETWRIIGIFNVKTASGSTEKLMKIVRDASLGNYAWKAGESGVNNGIGINQWAPSTKTDGTPYYGADLMIKLNDSYLNRTGDFGDAKTVKGIDSTSRNMIENVVWNTGAFSWGISAKDAYDAERETITGKNNCSGTYCNDDVIRTTTWTGKVGLIYPSDYGYASTYVNAETNKGCRDNINDNTNYSCKEKNWLHTGSSYWTISPRAYSIDASHAWNVHSTGFVNSSATGYGGSVRGVRPSVYLKSNVSITSGNGTSGEGAYELSMN